MEKWYYTYKYDQSNRSVPLGGHLNFAATAHRWTEPLVGGSFWKSHDRR